MDRTWTVAKHANAPIFAILYDVGSSPLFLLTQGLQYLHSKDEVVETESWLTSTPLNPELGSFMQIMDRTWTVAKHANAPIFAILYDVGSSPLFLLTQGLQYLNSKDLREPY